MSNREKGEVWARVRRVNVPRTLITARSRRKKEVTGWRSASIRDPDNYHLTPCALRPSEDSLHTLKTAAHCSRKGPRRRPRNVPGANCFRTTYWDFRRWLPGSAKVLQHPSRPLRGRTGSPSGMEDSLLRRELLETNGTSSAVLDFGSSESLGDRWDSVRLCIYGCANIINWGRSVCMIPSNGFMDFQAYDILCYMFNKDGRLINLCVLLKEYVEFWGFLRLLKESWVSWWLEESEAPADDSSTRRMLLGK